MPTKTIYISDDDQPLFTEAQGYADGNVSAAIIKGLKLFTEQQAASKEGFMQQTVTIRENGVKKQKHFMGRKLVSERMPEADGKRMAFYKIFKTQKGAYVYYQQSYTNWNWWSNPNNWERSDGPTTHEDHTSFVVCQSLNELKKHGATGELIESAKHAEQEPDEEYLDI